MLERTRRWAYLAVGWIALGLGLLGIPLPLLPTTPFVLLAAFCFARASQPLHDWLLAHPTFGPLIENYQTHRAISRSAKWLATLSLLAAICISLFLGVAPVLLAVQLVVLCCVAVFIWRHPDPPQSSNVDEATR